MTCFGVVLVACACSRETSRPVTTGAVPLEVTPEAQVRSTRAWENVGFESVDTIRGSAAMPLWGPLAAVVTPDSPLQNLSRIALPGATRQIVIQGDYVFGTADTSVFVWRMTRRI